MLLLALLYGITIRGLDEAARARLRLRAAHQGRSMEEEARQILKPGLATEGAQQPIWQKSIRRHAEPIGGMELTLSRRAAIQHPPRLDE